MKQYKTIIIGLSLLLLSGCGTKKEEILYTCKQDAIASTYSATFDYIIKTRDQQGISSIETSAIYTASFDDTDFSDVIKTLEEQKKVYQGQYTETDIDLDEKKEQIYFRVMIPINEHNLSLLQNIDDHLVQDGNLNIQQYKIFLENQGYTCK